MTCREVDEILIQSGNSKLTTASDAVDHLRSCERCRSIIDLMDGPADADVLDPVVLEAIEARLLSTLEPVSPLAPTWIWVGVFVLLSGAIALAGASVLGMHGLWAATPLQGTVILCAILVGASGAADALAREMAPGNKRQLSAGRVFAGSSIVLLLAFGLVFRDHSIADFTSSGVPCLVTGLCFSVGTALVTGLLLRGGFILDPASAGLAAGMLAGLTGIGMLELHCPNLSAPHIIAWHLSVLAVSGAAGWLTGQISERRGIKPAL